MIRFLLGDPLPTAHESHQRLSIWQALAVFSSDALSSVAYATEEILWVFLAVGLIGLSVLPGIGLAIVLLLAMIVISYRQTTLAYPSGGGAYSVARENMGEWAGLVAAAALLIDYILTAAVSVSAGVLAVTSALPHLSWEIGVLFSKRIWLCFFFLALVTWMHLRGIRESAKTFAFPTYFFIVICGILIISGLIKGPPAPGLETATRIAEPISLFSGFLLLRAFSSGCTALTGVEAVSNGTPVFQPPEGKNAAIALLLLGAILVPLFSGITWLAYQFALVPQHNQTLMSQIGQAVFGEGTVLYYTLQAATTGILLLAANTAFADFPRISSLLARDGFLPKQLANRGDRLVFANGIILLAFCAAFLIWQSNGSAHLLMPLYAVGVFLCFTLSQTGMVIYALRSKKPGWRFHAGISAIGATVTGIVFLVMAITKFKTPDHLTGAWMVLATLPIIILLFRAIQRHYHRVNRQLTHEIFHPQKAIAPLQHTAILLVSRLHPGMLRAIQYARSIDPSARAVHVAIDPNLAAQLVQEWEGIGMQLIVLPSPDRSLIEPVLRYIDEVDAEKENDLMTVIVPELVEAKWWHYLLHNQDGHLLRFALGLKQGIVVADIPYHLTNED
jgi:amino acid transporter